MLLHFYFRLCINYDIIITRKKAGDVVDISSLSTTIYLAIIPSILLCIYVYQMDVIEKEPVHLLFLLFFLGFLITVPARFFEKIFISSFDITGDDLFSNFLLAFVVIALVEEGYKFIILFASSWKNKEFDYKYDAIVYSVFISLGFATLENVLYVQSSGLRVAFSRGIISVPAHAFYAIASGFFLGLAKEKSVNNKAMSFFYIILAFLVPILLHGLFDFLLLTENKELYGVFFSFVALLYIVSFYAIKKTHMDKNKLKKIRGR